jgi:hypothetical protein
MAPVAGTVTMIETWSSLDPAVEEDKSVHE